VSRGNGPNLSDLLSFGVTTAACLVTGLLLGWLADAVLDTLPVFTLVGLALGIVGSGLYIYGEFKKFLKE
jgi:F0F1-type ATP synthase assembly protein I